MRCLGAAAGEPHIGDVVIGRGAGEGDCCALRCGAGKAGELACCQGGKFRRHVCSRSACAGRKRQPRHRDRIARFHGLEGDGGAFGRASAAASDVDRVLRIAQRDGVAALAGGDVGGAGDRDGVVSLDIERLRPVRASDGHVAVTPNGRARGLGGGQGQRHHFLRVILEDKILLHPRQRGVGREVRRAVNRGLHPQRGGQLRQIGRRLRPDDSDDAITADRLAADVGAVGNQHLARGQRNGLAGGGRKIDRRGCLDALALKGGDSACEREGDGLRGRSAEVHRSVGIHVHLERGWRGETGRGGRTADAGKWIAESVLDRARPHLDVVIRAFSEKCGGLDGDGLAVEAHLRIAHGNGCCNAVV